MRYTMRYIIPTVLAVLGLAVHAAESVAAPAFAKPPAVTRKDGKAAIAFAVTSACDVAVYVENANGKIVRHLAAGVLGPNAPAPLKANALEQTLEWDGLDDDGKSAGPDLSAFKVRVGLGLTAHWGGLAFADPDKSGPNRVESVLGLAAGPDGRVYVLDQCSAWLYWNTTRVHVFRRDGAYEKTIKPFPSNLPPERLKGIGAFVNSFGHLNPVLYRALGFSFYTHDDSPHQPAVTKDGRIVLATRTADTHYYATGAVGGGNLAMIDTDGGIPEATYAGPGLKAGWTGFAHLAASGDGKAVYFTGLGAHNAWGASKPWHALYRAPLPERGPQEAVFGDPAAAGSDEKHLNDPRGVAFDGQGHVLVADHGNNRVVVLNEKDMSFAGSFAVEAPDWLAVHPKTGAVYVSSKQTFLLRFGGWKDAKEEARADFAGLLKGVRPDQRAKASIRFAFDSSAEPPQVWAGHGAGLVIAKDEGAKFSEPAPAGCAGTQFFWRPAADPTRRWVGCRIGGQYGSSYHVLDEATGEVKVLGGDLPGREGRTHRIGPDGSIYGVDHAAPVIRYAPDGKPMPFEATLSNPALKGRLPAGNTGTTAWERDFYVDRKNEIYVRKRGPQYHGHMVVEVYGQDGARKRTVLYSVSDAMYGPKVDPQGNLYIMDMIKAPGQPYPKEFEGRLTTKRAPHWNNWIYGSVIKFGPRGGAIWFNDGAALPLEFDGWRVTDSNSVANLRIEGGSLQGEIAKKPAQLACPIGTLDAAAQKTIGFRMKNASDGSTATLFWHVLGEGYGTPARKLSIPIKPNSDFTEYTFDLSNEKEWKGSTMWFSVAFTDGAKGSFAVDWFRVGAEGGKPGWTFDTDDTAANKLPADLKSVPVSAFTKAEGPMLQGALWYRDGFSPVGKTQGNDQCHCTGSDFDVDDFGRVFAPDTGRGRVGVLDANGNELLSFGGYGNQNYCGPESYVIDPETKLLRPRKAGDPKDLASPFAEPELAFGWIVGLAVTDRFAYVGDVINKRILRVKLGYSAEATATIKK